MRTEPANQSTVQIPIHRDGSYKCNKY